MGRIERALEQIRHELELRKDTLNLDPTLRGMKLVVRFDPKNKEEISLLQLTCDFERVLMASGKR